MTFSDWLTIHYTSCVLHWTLVFQITLSRLTWNMVFHHLTCNGECLPFFHENDEREQIGCKIQNSRCFHNNLVDDAILKRRLRINMATLQMSIQLLSLYFWTDFCLWDLQKCNHKKWNLTFYVLYTSIKKLTEPQGQDAYLCQ